MELKPVNRIRNTRSSDFVEHYMKKTHPVIVEDFVRSDSLAFSSWNYDYFKKLAGNVRVNVFGGEMENLNRVASKPVGNMKFSEYLDLILKEPTELRLFLFNLLNIKPELKKEIRYHDITGGKILDWLPFMFFGGEGSVTRNHIDIDMSHVFITQFQGIKRIWLFPPEQSDLLYRLPYSFHSIAHLKETESRQFPGLASIRGYEAVIHPGETLYIPSGWWHYIQYETEGYSVSVRALPFSIAEKWKGFRNVVIIRNFDNLLRTVFGNKWYCYKVRLANKRAKKALEKLS